jgi:RNaseH domain of pPIWI_RE
MHRVQAALYDLLFGHAGLGPVPADLVDATFEEKSRPKSIVGISVVSQSASRNGRPEGATLAVAMRVDVATGRISGRIGRLKNGAMDRGAFQTLSRTLLEVASAGLTSIGDKQPDRRRNFVSFVRGVVDEVVRDDPNALILMESTTARSLWSWLSDESISSEVYLEDATARPPTSWKSLTFRTSQGAVRRATGFGNAAPLDSGDKGW